MSKGKAILTIEPPPESCSVCPLRVLPCVHCENEFVNPWCGWKGQSSASEFTEKERPARCPLEIIESEEKE